MKKQEEMKSVPTSVKLSPQTQKRLMEFNHKSELGYPAIMDFAVAQLFRELDQGATLGYPDGVLAIVRPESSTNPNHATPSIDPKLIDERLKSIETALVAISKKSWGFRADKNLKGGEDKNAQEI